MMGITPKNPVVSDKWTEVHMNNPWNTGTPTEGGWYLFQFMDKYGIWYSAEYLVSERIEKLASLGKFEMCAWQKIQPYEEASE